MAARRIRRPPVGPQQPHASGLHRACSAELGCHRAHGSRIDEDHDVRETGERGGEPRRVGRHPVRAVGADEHHGEATAAPHERVDLGGTRGIGPVRHAPYRPAPVHAVHRLHELPDQARGARIVGRVPADLRVVRLQPLGHHDPAVGRVRGHDLHERPAPERAVLDVRAGPRELERDRTVVLDRAPLHALVGRRLPTLDGIGRPPAALRADPALRDRARGQRVTAGGVGELEQTGIDAAHALPLRSPTAGARRGHPVTRASMRSNVCSIDWRVCFAAPRTTCLPRSWVMSHVSRTSVPPSVGSSS